MGLIAKIAFAGDLHKRSKDITTIEGYVNANVAVQRALMQMIHDLRITHFISLGDWYDRGYASDIAASLVDYDIDIEMQRMLNGEFYGIIGNHIRINMDSNPELHIIQPHSVYKSRRATTRREQIMRTPDLLRVGNVQISFLHHDKNAEDALAYRCKRRDWATYHIALFHTPYIVPNAQLLKTRYMNHVSTNSKITRVLEGVDLAIVGDIHNALGQFRVEGPDWTTTMVVPGSLTNTNASEEDRHYSINIPIVEVDDSSRVTLQYQVFDLKTNLLTFKPKNVEAAKDKLRSLRGRPQDGLYKDDDSTVLVSSAIEEGLQYTSMNAFLQAQGYTERDKKLIRSVLDNPGDLNRLIDIYREEL